MAHLTTAQRRNLPPSAFALPARRALPLTNARGNIDVGHVRAAAARLSMMRNAGNVSPSEYASARRRIEKAAEFHGAVRRYEKRKKENRPMSRALARRNPSSSVGMAVGANALFAGGGAVIGAIAEKPVLQGALDGAQTGLWITTIGGAIVGFVSGDGPRRDGGLALAGVGLLGLLGVGLVNRLLPAATPPAA